MKHSLYFLIIITLLFAGCRQKAQSNFQSESSAQTEKSNPSLEEYAEEAVITGKVLNRDFYPQEKELTLIIPFFRDMGNQYRSPIQKDGSFSFRFPVYAKLREVSIRNYAEHLYILLQQFFSKQYYIFHWLVLHQILIPTFQTKIIILF